jgi:hypothetical protein
MINLHLSNKTDSLRFGRAVGWHESFDTERDGEPVPGDAFYAEMVRAYVEL